MNTSILKIIPLVMCFFSACNISSLAGNNVVINRISSNDSIRVSCWEPSIFGDNRICGGQFISQGNNPDFAFNISSPKVYEIATFHGALLSIYVTPGDSVTYLVKRDEGKKNGEVDLYYLEFYGKNAAHYNFNILRYRTYRWPFFNKGDSIEKFKQILLAEYHEQMDFLSDYVKNNPVSDDFTNWAKACITNEYVFHLYLPLVLGDVTMKDIPGDYFNDAKIAANDLSNYYALATNAYIQFYMPDTYSNFSKIYNSFVHNESGKWRAYLLSSTIGFFAEKQNRNYFNELLQAIDEAPKYVTDSVYLDYIDKSKKFYLSVDEQFPDSVLENSFLTPYGKKENLSLKEVLEIYKDKALYIDFWASWCGPCRRDISQSQDTKKYLDENQIEYLYISIDNNEKNWINATNEDKIDRNQFRLNDSKNSPLLKYLEMAYIPRYLLINKEHKIKDFAAPGPTVESLNVLKESIQMNFEQKPSQTITYY